MKNLISKENEIALNNIQKANALWVDVKYAHEVFENMDRYTILHAGPPIDFTNMCEPMNGAVIAALIFEGVATNEEEVRFLTSSHKIKFYPCNDFDAVAPMTGIISYSMPLYVVEDDIHGNLAYSTINEGQENSLAFGFNNDIAINRLKWIQKVLAPVLKKSILAYGKLSVKSIMAEALNMGDELHMRSNAASNLFLSKIIGTLIEVVEEKEELKEVIKYISTNTQFFLNLSMAAAKVMIQCAHNIDKSTIVTTMSRNGVEVGIKVSGLGNQWFTAPAKKVKGLYLLNYSEEDGNLDIGDSAILEVIGLGAFSIEASPTTLKFLGTLNYNEAITAIRAMEEITLDESKSFRIPNNSLKGAPIAIDMIKVIETGIAPMITTGVVSKERNIGIIGAGISKIPVEAFEKALLAYAEKYSLLEN
jgi:hypothetical protein